MAIVFMRRSAALAVTAAVATIAAPIAGALAAPAAFAASGITTQPAPNSSNVVPANRPTVVATFSDNLSTKSTITLVEKGSSTNLCTAFTVKDKQVSCQPPSDLALGKTYDAVGHGVSTSGAKADTKQLEFTVSYPKFDDKNSSPIPGGSIVNGSETLVAAFDQDVTGNKDTFAANGAFKVFEVNPNGTRGTQLAGTIDFPSSSPIGGTHHTVTFAPASTLANGKYEAVVLVNGVNSSGAANPDAIGHADYFFYVDNSAPGNLKSGAANNTANNTNSSKFPLTGTAAPGLTITVTAPDSSTPAGLNDASATGTVPTCGSAICPWTVTIDVSGLPDNPSQPWSATASDPAGNKTAAGTGTPFVIDQTAPPAPTVTSPADGSTVGRTITVSATDSDNTVTGYHVTVTDPEKQTVEADLPATNGAVSGATVDISSLDDGSLTVLVQAKDAAGNLSAPPSSFPPGQQQPPTVTKKTSFDPNLDTSLLSSTAGGDTTFTQAITHAVRSPETVTLRFSQTVELSYTDNSTLPPKTHNSSLCVATTAGNCVTSASPTLTDDKHGLVIKISSPLSERTYTVRATTYAAGLCPDVNPGGTDNCAKNGGVFSGTVMNGAQPFTFTVDNTPPTVTVTRVSPNPITPAGVTNVSISGTVSPDVNAQKGVQLTLKSSGGGPARLQTATVTPATAAGQPATWSVSGLDLSQMRDGTLTVTAKAFDTANNAGTGTGTATLAAHRSYLFEVVNKHRTTFGHVVTVSGKLFDQSANPITSATITVQPRYDNGKLGAPSTATTDSAGHWSLLAAPSQNSRFIASYAGTTTAPLHDAARTNTAKTLVHVRLGFTSPKNHAHVSRKVTLKGKVAPNKHGKVVRLYRTSGHGLVLLGKDRLNKHSHWSLTVKLPRGHVTVLAKIGKTKGNLGGTSPKRRLTVG